MIISGFYDMQTLQFRAVQSSERASGRGRVGRFEAPSASTKTTVRTVPAASADIARVASRSTTAAFMARGGSGSELWSEKGVCRLGLIYHAGGKPSLKRNSYQKMAYGKKI